ncbi:DUF3048 domain-containing protein [candidate division WWE3 bacterium]|nr:DUF3048 domain-containing protein [candidate division WWE3 bacterium]
MKDDIVIDEKQIINTHKVGLIGRIKSLFKRSASPDVVLDNGQRIALSLGVLALFVVLIGGGGFIYVLSQKESKNENVESQITTIPLSGNQIKSVEVKDPEEPKNQNSPLNGVLLTSSEYSKLMQKLPLVVMVENHPDARPQSGLDKADLVFETLAEGGITRFAGVYLTNEPEVVGPVRSVRKYFLDLIGFLDDSLIMHIGGAQSTNPEADALGEIQKQGVKSLGVSGGKFWRVTDRLAPHNAYSNTKDLWSVAASNGWHGPVSINLWPFKDSAVSADQSAAVQKVQINWTGSGSNDFSTIWNFDASQNVYKRSFVSGPHKDAVTNQQLTARNVVILYAPMSSANDGSARITFKVIGSGKSLILQDGNVIKGTYEKLTRKSGLNLKNQSGETVKMNRGQTWVLLVPDNAEVIY